MTEKTVLIGKREVQLEVEVLPYLSKSGAGVEITKISTLDKDNLLPRQFRFWKSQIEKNESLMGLLNEDAQAHFDGIECEYDNTESAWN